MSEYATRGATLICTGGSAPSKLQVTSNSLLSVQGNQVATVTDKAPMANIMPFGACGLKPFSPPCSPAPTAWTGFLPSVNIPGGNPLLLTSMIPCACGGIIKFMDSGQMKPQKVVLSPMTPQIEALRNAAIQAVPFCEECEKRKKAEKDPDIIRIYWMDEKGEMRTVSELFPGQEVTLCVDVEEGGAGKTIDLVINCGATKFKGGKDKLEYKGLTVEGDNTAYVDNFVIEYDGEE